MGNIKAKALVDTLAAKLAEAKVQTLGQKPSEVEAHSPVATLADTTTDLKAKTLATHWAMWRPRLSSTRWLTL